MVDYKFEEFKKWFEEQETSVRQRQIFYNIIWPASLSGRDWKTKVDGSEIKNLFRKWKTLIDKQEVEREREREQNLPKI